MAAWNAFVSEASISATEAPRKADTKSFQDIKLNTIYRIQGCRVVPTRFGNKIVVTIQEWDGSGILGDPEERWGFPRLEPLFVKNNKDEEFILKPKKSWPAYIGFDRTKPTYQFHYKHA